jgi:hypothetical protein
MRFLAAVLLCVFLLPFSLQAQDPSLTVDESQVRAQLSDNAIELDLPVLQGGAAAHATLHVDLVDPDDKVLSRADQPVLLPSGRSIQRLSIPVPWVPDRDAMRWARVRYSVSTEQKTLIGIVALGAIQPELFRLRVAYPEKARPGRPYRLRILANNPVTKVGNGGVQVSATMKFDADDSEKPQTVHATTGRNGETVLTFNIPREPKSEPEIEVKAVSGRQEQTERINVSFDIPFQVITSTDKELYQPGQEFHARALCLGPDRRAYPKQSLRFTLQDPDENVLLRDTVQTNEFGIASVDWQLPESARLGDYNLLVEYADDVSDNDFPTSTSLVKISRYDLPNFSVTAVPDHPYYLPGQDASVKIGAQYLFGRPLLHGSLKVVREEERRWNYTTQKWDVDESDEVRGELDEKGNYDLKLKLAQPFEEFADQNYERFRDLSYAAYITDKTTGKTEQRRFTIRISHDRVHMYITREEYAGGVASFYIATYFPDGTSAPCNVQLSELIQEKDQPMSRLLRMFSTNKYGVAKVSNLNLASRGDHSLKFVLIDPNGAWTTHTEDLWFGGYARESENIVVDTDHAIYKSGDAIYATIRTARDAGTLMMDVTQDGTVLRTISIHPHDGHASVTIPFEPDFKRELTLAVYNLPEAGTYRWDMPFGAHTVIFPEDRTLDVDARLSKASYRPGEDADVAIRVLDRDGNPAPSAFGVVVFDKAVEERVHTDQDFGGNSRYGFWSWGWWYNPESYGGISRQYLESYDVEKGVPKDLDTVAEVLLNSTTQYALPQITGNDYTSTIRNVFQDALNKSLQPLAKWLYSSTPFPRDEAQLKKVAAEHGVALNSVLDPWGQPYHYSFEFTYGEFSVVPTSAGPDKKFGTADDISWNDYRQSIFYPYVDQLRSALLQAQSQHALHLGDETSLKRTLAAAGMDFDRNTDPWGRPYKIAIAVTGPSYTVTVTSLGPKADTNPVEIRAWSEDIHYFTDDRVKINDALAQSRHAGTPFPRTEKEFNQILKAAGVERESLRDPWNDPYQVKFSQSAQYSDAVSISGGTIGGKQTTTPITLHLWNISILSNGSDRKPDTPDDILVERFMSFVDEQTGKQAEPVKVDGVELNPYSGAIRGVVTDPTGAVVAGATITAKRADADTKFEATSDENGKFLLKNLPSGIYQVTVTAAGFTAWNRDAIPVRSASATEIAASLSVGGAGTTVEVTAEASSTAMNTTSQTLASIVTTSGGFTKLSNYTPRLREFFPETLLWQPSVITRRDGTSKLHFKLADNITTWKLSLLASDKDGRVGYLQKELQAFQPFFVEHDPPKILTAGDELQLPVVVRNYLEKPQTVSVTMKPESWFTLLGDSSQELSVPAGDSSNAIFGFRATAFIHEGKQRVTAANHALGDAVEKPVTVHPNGREDATFATRIISSDDAFDYDLPSGIIPTSLHAQVKLYPNLVAHAVDAIEAGLERPYGCGEQTISSTYPSLMVLQYLSKHPGTDPVIAARAHRYLEQGYRRLLNYRSTDGGFTYWGSGEPDSALTAYAIRFLRDAAQFIKVDEDVVPDAELWLIRAQTKDGWQPQYGRSENLTSYVALTLSGAPATDKNEQAAKTAVGKALSHLGAVAEQYEDPYEIATVGLLALRVGDRPSAERSATILRKKALAEGQTSYWELVENTPFYGWGHAGAVETTALVVRFLREMNSPNDRDLIQRGLLYMLANKDRYGVWYSGQTTQQVLHTMMEFLDTGDNGGSYQLEINGKSAADVTVSSNQVAPSFVDISKYLESGKNHVVVHRNSKGGSASLQVASDYYTPWTGETATESVRTGDVRGLKLRVDFDTHQARVGEDIHCKVYVERFGSRGWGMMLAEIGLPPGVDVDRASLDKAMGNFGINQYDVLPDRLVLYLWPQAGGTQFEFTFRPRIAMQAMNAQSVLFDYYNPEEQVVVAPERFSVRPELGKAVAGIR